MKSEAKAISEHYLGERGKKYFAYFPDPSVDLARQYQAGYFRKFCSDEIVLLDYGCGNGLFLRCLPARERIGIEVNPHARQACMKACEKESIPITLYAHLESVETNYVDVVISNHCLEHVLNPFTSLREVLRILKPGGTLVLILPYNDFRPKNMRTWFSGDINNHLYTWTPMLLGNLLVEAGFQIESAHIYTRSMISRIFWIRQVFGEAVFRVVRYLICIFQHRREVLCVATKKTETECAGGGE